MPKILQRMWDKSRISEFFAWWKFELVNCLPKPWQGRFNTQPAILVFSKQLDQNWQLARVRGDKREAERALEIAEPAAVRRIVGVLETLNDQSAERRVLALSGDKVLRKRLSFRQEIEPNLRAALALEMDKHTPFKAEQVYFDWLVVKRDLVQRMITVEFAVVPRAILDEQLQILQGAGLSVDAVDSSPSRGNVMPERCSGFNFLPSDRRNSEGDPQSRLRWILGFALAGLVWFSMWQSLEARQVALAHLQARTQKGQDEALKVAKSAQALRNSLAAANFLVEKRRTEPEVVKVLLELTQLIPDDTYIERMTFTGRTVAIFGQSASAEKLISLLENARYVSEPQFQGGMQPDPGTGKERFSLQMTLRDEVIVAEKSRGSGTADKSRGSGTAEMSRGSGTADNTPAGIVDAPTNPNSGITR